MQYCLANKQLWTDGKIPEGLLEIVLLGKPIDYVLLNVDCPPIFRLFFVYVSKLVNFLLVIKKHQLSSHELFYQSIIIGLQQTSM